MTDSQLGLGGALVLVLVPRSDPTDLQPLLAGANELAEGARLRLAVQTRPPWRTSALESWEIFSSQPLVVLVADG